MNPWEAFAAQPVWAVVVVLASGWGVARVVVAVGQAVDLVRRGRAKP